MFGQQRLGFDGDHLLDGRRMVGEVGAGPGADLEHPAGQRVEVLRRSSVNALGLVRT